MPIHPLRGVPLGIRYKIRDQQGRRFVVAEDPAGFRLVLPVDWTDLVPATAPSAEDSVRPHFSVEALLKLVALTDGLRTVDNKFAISSAQGKLPSGFVGEGDGGGAASGNLANDAGVGAEAAARGLGDTGAPSGSRASGFPTTTCNSSDSDGGAA